MSQKNKIAPIFLCFFFFFNQLGFCSSENFLHVLQNPQCDRNVYVNYKQITIDNGTINRGQGLRFYLQNDPVALDLLEQYQKNAEPGWFNIAFGSLGTTSLIWGLARPGSITSSNQGFPNKQMLILGGVLTLVVNYLIFKTNAYQNEKTLYQAIEEYNKRNIPKIKFMPYPESDGMKNGLFYDFNIEF